MPKIEEILHHERERNVNDLVLCLSLRKDGGGRGSIEEMESILSKRQYKSININYYEKVFCPLR